LIITAKREQSKPSTRRHSRMLEEFHCQSHQPLLQNVALLSIFCRLPDISCHLCTYCTVITQTCGKTVVGYTQKWRISLTRRSGFHNCLQVFSNIFDKVLSHRDVNLRTVHEKSLCNPAFKAPLHYLNQNESYV